MTLLVCACVCGCMCRLGGASKRRVFEEADVCQHEEKSTRTNTVQIIIHTLRFWQYSQKLW